MGLGTLAAIQAGLWIVSYLLREDPPEDGDPSEEKRRGSTTLAEEGTTPSVVIGTARVRRTNILMYEGPGSWQDYLRESYIEINNQPRRWVVTALLGVCVRPPALFPATVIRTRRFWAGDTLVFEPGPDGVSVTNVLNNTNEGLFSVHAENIWGGSGKGGGVGSFLSEPALNFPNGNRGGSGVVRFFDGTNDIVESFHMTNIVEAGPNLGPEPDFLLNQGGLSTGNHYGAMPGMVTMLLDNFMVGERPSMPGFSIEMTVWPDTSTVPIPIVPTVSGVSNVDANPMSALYKVLTDDLIGIGLEDSDLDLVSFSTAATTLDAEGNGFSIALDKPVPAKKLIQIIIKQIDGVLFVDPETSLISVRLVREDYGAFPYAGLDVFDDDDVLEVVSYKETSFEDAHNQVRVKYEDRASDYAERYAVAQNHSSATSSGRTRSVDVSFPGVKTASLANALASRELKFHSTPQLLVVLKVTRRAGTLRPGDVIKWTWQKDELSPTPQFHVENMVLRVHQVDFGTYDDGTILLTCSRDKYSNIASVFADPDRHWLDDFGIRPEAPDCLVVVETPQNPFFGSGGSNQLTPSLGVVATFASPVPGVTPGPNSPSSLSQLSVSTFNSGDEVFSAGSNSNTTRCGTVGVAYSKSSGGSSYYDTSGSGLEISLSDSSVLRNSTESEVRQGRSVLLLGGSEYISYESFTELTPTTFRLNNVWRGLFDTKAEDHPINASVFFVSDTDIGKVTAQRKFLCGQGVTFRVDPIMQTRRQKGAADVLIRSINISRRSSKAARATNFTISNEGFDAVGTHRDVEYAFDLEDEKKVSVVPFVGDDSVSESDDLGTVFTNDLLGSWRRRPVPVDCEGPVVRGDDLDVPLPVGDKTHFIVEGKRDIDSEFSRLQDKSLDGELDIVSATDFVGLGRLLPGPGQVQLTSVVPASDTGEELHSHVSESISVDMVSARQLLINRKMRPYWDVNAEDGRGGYGPGLQIRGSGDNTARAWRSIGDTIPFFGVPTDTPLEQGDDTQGHAFWGETHGDGIWTEVEQIVPVPYQDVEGSEVLLYFYYYREATAATDRFRATIEALDASGAVVNTVTTGEVDGTHARGWTRVDLALAGMASATTSLRFTLGVSNVAEVAVPNANAIGNVAAYMGREISAQLLTNQFFAPGLAGWTQTTPGWTTPSSVPPLDHLDKAPGRTQVLVPPASSPATIEQFVALPAEFSPGDWVRFTWWSASTGGTDGVTAVVQARSAVNAVIDSFNFTQYLHTREDQWFVHEGWLQIPDECTNINIQIIAEDGGGGLQVAVAQADLRCIKSDPRSSVMDFSAPVHHTAPISPDAFEAATGAPGVTPIHIFPMQEGPGQAPADVLQGASFDDVIGVEGSDFDRGNLAPGLMGATDPISDRCLEVSKFDGGVKSTDLDFMDARSGSFGIYFQYRLLGGSALEGINVISKSNSRYSPVGGFSFQVSMDPFNGVMNFVCCNPSGLSSEGAMPLPADDAWHWAFAKFDVAGNLTSLFGDHSTGTAAESNSPLVAEGFTNTIDEVTIGRNAAVTGIGSDGSDTPLQLRYLAYFRGRGAELFTKAAGDTLWTHGTDPNTDQGLDLLYTRANELLVPISDNHVGVFGGSSEGAAVQVPFGHNVGFLDTNKLGLPSFGVVQNLVPFSEDMLNAAWTAVGCTVAAKAEISPRGAREMHVVTQTALGGSARVTLTGLTQSTQYIFSGYMLRVGGNTTTFVSVTEQDLSTILVGSAIPAGVSAERFTLSFTTQVGQTQAQLRLSGSTIVGTAGATGYWGVMVQEGDEVYPIVLNPDATLNVSSATIQRRVSGTPGDVVTADEGAVQVTYAAVSVASAADRTVFDIRSTIGSEDRRSCVADTTGAVTLSATDGVGAAVATTGAHPVLSANTEIIEVAKWRAKTDLEQGAFKLVADNGSDTQTQNPAAWVSDEGIGELHIGMDANGQQQVQGVIQKIKFWKGEPTDLSF